MIAFNQWENRYFNINFKIFVPKITLQIHEAMNIHTERESESEK